MDKLNDLKNDFLNEFSKIQDLEGPSYQTYFVYSESFKNDRRLEVFRDFLFNEAKDWHY